MKIQQKSQAQNSESLENPESRDRDLDLKITKISGKNPERVFFLEIEYSDKKLTLRQNELKNNLMSHHQPKPHELAHPINSCLQTRHSKTALGTSLSKNNFDYDGSFTFRNRFNGLHRSGVHCRTLGLIS